MSDLRICNTDTLTDLASDAEKQGFNRAPRLPERLDPEGNHVLNRVLYGHNMEGAAPLHHRVLVLAKVEGTDEPAEFMLDITETNWQALHRPEAVLGAA